MNQQDFLLKEIEKISQVLIALINKLTGSINFENEILQINKSLIEQFDFDILELEESKDQTLVSKLDNFNNRNLELLIELIIEIIHKNNLIKNNTKIDSEKLVSKGLFLINHINLISKDYSINRQNLHNELIKLKNNENI